MNASRMYAVSLVFVALLASAVSAAPSVGPPKARGQFGGGGWVQSGGGGGRSYAGRASRAPVYRSYSPAVVQAAPAPRVAPAPIESRRFSYAPQAVAAAAAPCPHSVAVPSTVNSGRRYSQAPSAPVANSAPVYRQSPGVVRSSAGRGRVERWALPKTDPRKYSSR